MAILDYFMRVCVEDFVEDNCSTLIDINLIYSRFSFSSVCTESTSIGLRKIAVLLVGLDCILSFSKP